MKLTLIVLGAAGLGAALVSDWFVEALQPAMKTLGISETFAGLVVVAVAGNAIENVIGIQLAWRNQADYAVSVILNSSLQIALGLVSRASLLVVRTRRGGFDICSHTDAGRRTHYGRGRSGHYHL